MYRKGKKNSETGSSLDLNALNEGSSKGFNYFVERAKGAVSTFTKERTRSTSYGSEDSRAFFTKGLSNETARRDGTVFASPSMQNLNSTTTTNPKSAPFYRRVAVSTGSRPSWLTTTKPTVPVVSPLVVSPSSPNLSDLTEVTASVNPHSRSLEDLSLRNTAPAISLSQEEETISPSLPLLPAHEDTSRSFLSEPSSFLTRHSSEDLKSQKKAENRSRTSSEDSVNGAFLGITNPIKMGKARSLSPSNGSSQPTLSSSVPTSFKAMHKSSSRSFTSTSMSTATSNSSTFSAGSKSTTPVPFPTSSSAPDMISESFADPSLYNKRDSQTVLFQGFLQRKSDYSPPAVLAVKAPYATNSPLSGLTLPLPLLPGSPSSLKSPISQAPTDLDLQKGWKPYKVILKGSKLYLYKIPNEFTTTVKSLFPSTIVIDSSPFSSNSNSPRMTGIVENEPRKKQRAFWGIGHHPGLMLSKGKERESVIGGTCEGLVHELIFGTTFMSATNEEGEVEQSTSQLRYDSFSSLLFLFWPFLPFSSSQTATELNRCASLAVRTILEEHGKETDSENDGKARALGKRLERIISTVVKEYPEDLFARGGSTKEASDTKSALQELIQLLASLEEIYQKEEGDQVMISKELSEQLEEGFSRPAAELKQPQEWSYRPTFNRSGSSSNALLNSSPTKATKKKPASLSPGESDPATTLFISNTSFLNFDPVAFARQVYLFHLDRFKSLSDISISRQILNAAERNLVDESISIISLFSFTLDKPHFLTRLVVQTIFPTIYPVSTGSPSPGVNENRTKIIERWITVGEELKRLGDTAGWIAVVLAICSRPIARLTDVWRGVNYTQLSLVRNGWSSALIEAQAKGYSLVNGGIPYLGNMLEEGVKVLKEIKKTNDDLVGAVDLLPLYELSKILAGVDTTWDKALSIIQVPPRPDLDLQYYFQVNSRLPASPFPSSLFLASLEVQSRLSGQLSELFYKPRVASEPSPLIPLLMIEPLPHIFLVDRTKILSSAGGIARKASNGGLSEFAILQGKGLDPYSSRITPGRLVRNNSFPPHVSSVDIEANVRYLAKIKAEMESPIKYTDESLTRLAKIKYDMDTPTKNVEETLRMAEGDLVFKIISNTLSPALPATTVKGLLSRTASWIEARSSRSSRASRRASVASISTLPASLSRVTSILESGSSSKRSSMMSTSTGVPKSEVLEEGEAEGTISIVVKAGTIESLVDLLVVGIDPSLRTVSKPRSSLVMDGRRYRVTFFSTYRAFISPMALLDMIRKRYISAPSASEAVPATLEKPFPLWSMVPILDTPTVNWQQAGSIRASIITSLEHWIDNHLQDFLDDEETYSSLSAFLHFVQQSEIESAALGRSASVEEVELLVKRFNSESLRPRIRSKRNLLAAAASDDRKPGLSFDNLTVTELVDRLDRIASDVSRNLNESDLMSYAETLEGLTAANSAIWYSSKKVDDEDLVINDPYSHLIALGLDSTTQQQMPASLRHAAQAHSVMRRWVLGHLVDVDISLFERQTRMNKAIEIIELCRSRMSNVIIGGSVESQSSILDPSIASFVERVVTSAIVSPASRLFSSAWQNVAYSRGVAHPDSVQALIRKELVLTDATSAIDFGWVTERLLEIVTQVDNLTEGASLNFDKRRLLFDFISKTLEIRPAQSGSSELYLDAIEKRLSGWGNWGMRILRDVASGEGTKLTKSAKPFYRLVNAQQEKIRRDKITRDFVLKGKKLESIGRASRDRDIAKAMERTVTNKTRRMTAIFSRTARPEAPITIAPTQMQIQSLNGWMPTAKPFLVFALSGVQVVALQNGQRSFVFEMATEEGQRSIFQAQSKTDLEIWLKNLKQSGQSIAVRRATFLAQTALTEEPEELLITKPTNIKGVFGVPLWKVLETEGSTIPILIEKALEAIEERGLSEVGIYRISGENRVVHAMKDALNRGADPVEITSNAYVHDLSSLVKLFLRELPEPVIPFNLYAEFIAATEIEDYDTRHFAIRDLTWKMPEANFHLLRRLTEHLDRVTDNESVNSMFAANLSICFAPTLMKPDGDAFGLAMLNLGKAASVISSFILQQHWIFGSLETEAVEEVAEEVETGGLGFAVVGLPEEVELESDQFLDVEEEKPLPLSPLLMVPASPTTFLDRGYVSSGGDSFHSTTASPNFSNLETF